MVLVWLEVTPGFLPNIIMQSLYKAFKGDGWSFNPLPVHNCKNKFSSASWLSLLSKIYFNPWSRRIFKSSSYHLCAQEVTFEKFEDYILHCISLTKMYCTFCLIVNLDHSRIIHKELLKGTDGYLDEKHYTNQTNYSQVQ